MSAIRIIETEAAEAFLEALSPSSKLWGGRPGDWIYRGLENSAYRLVPAAYREPWPLEYLPESLIGDQSLLREHDDPRRVAATEVNNFEKFLMLANEVGLPTAGGANDYLHETRRDQIQSAKTNMSVDFGYWPPDNLIPAVALAQHHGIPTRMLDWSLRSLVAAYFAVRSVAKQVKRGSLSPECKSACVWALNLPSLPSLNKAAPITKCRKSRYAFVQVPRADNANLHAQHGVFVLDRGYLNDRESLDEFVQNQCQEGALTKVTAPVYAAPRILRLLYIHGVGAATMFPGYDGVARQAREVWYWDVL